MISPQNKNASICGVGGSLGGAGYDTTITGIAIDITVGTTTGLNYRVGLPSFNEFE